MLGRRYHRLRHQVRRHHRQSACRDAPVLSNLNQTQSKSPQPNTKNKTVLPRETARGINCPSITYPGGGGYPNLFKRYPILYWLGGYPPGTGVPLVQDWGVPHPILAGGYHPNTWDWGTPPPPTPCQVWGTDLGGTWYPVTGVPPPPPRKDIDLLEVLWDWRWGNPPTCPTPLGSAQTENITSRRTSYTGGNNSILWPVVAGSES